MKRWQKIALKIIHRLVDKPTKQDIYLREESIFIQGYRQSEKRIAELEAQIETKDIQIKELQEQKCYWKESSFDWRHKFFKLDKVKRLIEKEKRIKELEKDINLLTDKGKLTDECKELEAQIEGKENEFQYFSNSYKKKIADLGKENAELKVIVRNTKAVDESFALKTVQLNKAKELLNEFMRISKASDEDFEHDYSELIGETEQFISEAEK